MATQSRFIIKHYDNNIGNFVDSQYLGNAYETGKAHVFQNTLMKIFSAKSRFFTGKFIINMTGGRTGGVQEIDSEIYRWYLQGAEKKSFRFLGDLEPSNTTKGLNNTNFRIWIDTDILSNPDVCLLEDNDFPIELLSTGTPYGGGFVYTARLVGDNPNAFVPNYLIESGRELDKKWTMVASEYNSEYGTQQAPSAFMLESQIGAFAQKLDVTDKAWRQSGRISIEALVTNPKTNKEEKLTSFLPMAEARMHDELTSSMEHQSIYGKSQTQPGPKGYWKKAGPGLRQQLADSWQEYYNGPLTVNRLKNYLMDIFFSRVDEGDRQVVAMTGTLGSLMFHDMLASEASSFLTLDTHFTSGSGRELAFGAQYNRYIGPEGIGVTLYKNPMYDDRTNCKRSHPQFPKYPIDSARFTFLDFGNHRTKDGSSSNIMMIREKNTYVWGYVPGTHTPTGPIQGGAAGGLIDGYTMFTKGTMGICMKDVTRGGELILDFEY